MIERSLSDRSKVYSVVIREKGELPFVEMDAISEVHAIKLRLAIREAVKQNTNIALA